MSRKETTIFFATLVWAGLRYYFCVSIMNVDGYVGILGGITILFIGYRLFYNQKRQGNLVFIGVFCTVLSFLFSLIPTYNAIPSLDAFRAMQIPKIVCDITHSWSSLLLNDTTLSMKTICSRTAYPLFVGQTIAQEKETPWNTTIDLGKWASIALQPGSTATITWSWWIYNAIFQEWSWIEYTGFATLTNTLQYNIARSYQLQMKQYVRNQYKRVREAAPKLTELAIRKMRLISLIDREYTNKIRNLRTYMQLVNQ